MYAYIHSLRESSTKSDFGKLNADGKTIKKSKYHSIAICVLVLETKQGRGVGKKGVFNYQEWTEIRPHSLDI
jgi:hypothetical protein